MSCSRDATRHIVPLLLFVLAASATQLAAQRTWIVDSANGPGTDFTDLDPAVAAAGVGDTIILRPGRSAAGVPYTLMRDITRGLRVVAPGNVPVLVDTRYRLISIPEGEMFVLDNVRFTGPGGGRGMIPQSSLGTVVVSRLREEPWDYSGIGSATDCARLIWTDCHVTMQWGVTAVPARSRVYILDSRMECLDSGLRAYMPIPFSPVSIEAGSTAWIVNSYVKGGDIAQDPNPNPAMPGMEVKANAVAIVAGRSEFIGGGVIAGVPAVPGLVVYGDPARLTQPHGMLALDPLTRCTTPRDTQGGRFEYLHEMPTVSPDDALRGQPQAIRLIGPSNGIMALFVSVLTPRPPLVTPIGDIWLDPATTVLIGGGAADQNRNLVLGTTIPNWLPTGEVLVYQSVAATSTNWLEFSPPGFAVVQ